MVYWVGHLPCIAHPGSIPSTTIVLWNMPAMNLGKSEAVSSYDPKTKSINQPTKKYKGSNNVSVMGHDFTKLQSSKFCTVESTWQLFRYD